MTITNQMQMYKNKDYLETKLSASYLHIINTGTLNLTFIF